MHLLDKIIDRNGKVKIIEDEILNNLEVNEKYIKRVKEGLHEVMIRGTGKSYTNISAGGKTGTSESFYDSDFDGRIDTETISTNFVMYAPSVNPKFAISITSPNISIPSSGYKYPINKIVIQNITKNIYNYIK